MLMWLNEESWQHYQISELKWLDYTLLEAIIYILIKDSHYSTLMAQKQSNNSEISNLRAKNISSSYVNLTNARLKNKHMKQNLKKKLFLLWMGKKKGPHKVLIKLQLTLETLLELQTTKSLAFTFLLPLLSRLWSSPVLTKLLQERCLGSYQCLKCHCFS